MPGRRITATGLPRDRLVDVDRQEAVPAVVGVEQRELLAAVDPVLGVVDVEHDARAAPRSKLSQNSSTMAAIIRLSAVTVGRFSSRHMVGCEHRSGPLSGARPTAILNAGSERRASQSFASG